MKKVMKSLYVHKSNLSELGEDRVKIVEERKKLIGTIEMYRNTNQELLTEMRLKKKKQKITRTIPTVFIKPRI